MSKFEHIRHKPPSEVPVDRELVLACAPLRSHVNLSSIVRIAGCAGVKKVYATGVASLERKVARDGAEEVDLEVRNSLVPILKKLRAEGFTLVGLEQTTNSHRLADYVFPEKVALVIGSERQGLTQEMLDQLHEVVEIPVYGLPHSYNVATATAMAVYEVCRQRP